MATMPKRHRPENGFYKIAEDGISLKPEKVAHKSVRKTEKSKLYPIEVSTA